MNQEKLAPFVRMIEGRLVSNHLGSLINDLVSRSIPVIRQSGQLPHDWETFAADFGAVISEKGDILQYPDKKNFTEWQSILKRAAVAIACMSFYPGGIKFCGVHHESSFDNGGD